MLDLLRAYCAGVATVAQAAAVRGVTVGKLTGREAVWADSDEGRAEQRREKERKIAAYREAFGTDPPEYGPLPPEYQVRL